MVVGASGVVALQREDPATTYIADGALTYNAPVSPSTNSNQIQQAGQILSKEALLSDGLIEDVKKKVNVQAEQIREKVDVELPEKMPTGELKTSVIVVKYQDPDPQRAKKTLNTLMDEIVRQSRDNNTKPVRQTINTLEKQLKDVEKELQKAEQKLATYDKTAKPELIAAEKGSLLNAVTGNQTQQQQIQQTLLGVNTQIQSLEKKLGLSPSQAFIASTLSADPSIAELRKQINQIEAQLAVLKRGIRPKHPAMVQLRRQQEAYNDMLQRQVTQVVGAKLTAATPSDLSVLAQSSLDPMRQQLANSLVNLQIQQETLLKQQDDLKKSASELWRQYKKYASIPDIQLERSRLEQDVQRRKARYDQIQTKLNDSKLVEAVTDSSFSIAKQAQVTEKESFRMSEPIILGMGALLGLLVGGGLIFLLRSFESKFQTWEDIRESLLEREVRLLGILPLLRGLEVNRQAIPVLISPDSPYIESYERCRSNLRSFGNNTLKVVLLSSTVSLEGKTISAYNLGVASARAGKKTLIVEANLRSPSQSQFLGVTPDSGAVDDPLHYYGNLSQCIQFVPEVENLFIVPSLGPTKQAAAILESNEMRLLLEFARSNFDLVILDTPALGFANDALLLEPYSDGIVLVTRPRYTKKKLLSEAITQLTELDLRLLGVIINGVDMPVSRTELAKYQEVHSSKTKSEEVAAGAR